MRVLIVDDDMATVDVIKNTVNWSKLGVEEVQIAYNINDAKKILFHSQMDIIISDIEMPQGSGIELLEWLRKQEMTTEFLLLTCHDEFDYASKALKNQASEYLLKPFNVNIMEAALKKIIVKIQEKRQILEESEYGKWMKMNQRQLKIDFWNQILSGHLMGDITKIEASVQKRKLEINVENSYRLIISKILNIEGEKMSPDLILFVAENLHAEILCGNPENDAVVSMTYPDYYVLITVLKDWDDMRLDEKCEGLRREIYKLLGAEMSICISCPCKINQFYEVFNKNLQLLIQSAGCYGNCFHEENVVVSEQEPQIILEVEKLEDFLVKRDKIKFLSYIKERLGIRVFEKKINETILRWAKEEILQAIYTYLGKKEIPISGLFQEDLMTLDHRASQSVIDLIRWTNYLLDCTFKHEENTQKSYGLVEKIDQYIREHYKENIGRVQIAEYIHLAPEYVAKTYKKQTGKTIKDTLVEYRIEEAKRLLERGERVGEVAMEVGIENFTYFSTVFKKITGFTPNQYRKNKEL